MGPFIAWGTLNADGGDARLLVVDGIAQIVGVSMLTIGLFMDSEPSPTSVALAPSITRDHAGLSARLRF